MQSQTSKIVLAVVITAVVAGGGVYFWQNKDVGQNKIEEPVAKLAEQAVQKPDVKDLFESAKESKNEFVYLVVAPKLNDEWRMVMKNMLVNFSFKYKSFPWGQLRYDESNLTDTDGDPGENGLPGFLSYKFCAGAYYCDMEKGAGMGFHITFWNAKYAQRSKNPDFYLRDGEKFLKETDRYVVTYKPFSDSSSINVDGEVENLIGSLEIY